MGRIIRYLYNIFTQFLLISNECYNYEFNVHYYFIFKHGFQKLFQMVKVNNDIFKSKHGERAIA